MKWTHSPPYLYVKRTRITISCNPIVDSICWKEKKPNNTQKLQIWYWGSGGSRELQCFLTGSHPITHLHKVELCPIVNAPYCSCLYLHSFRARFTKRIMQNVCAYKRHYWEKLFSEFPLVYSIVYQWKIAWNIQTKTYLFWWIKKESKIINTSIIRQDWCAWGFQNFSRK